MGRLGGGSDFYPALPLHKKRPPRRQRRPKRNYRRFVAHFHAGGLKKVKGKMTRLKRTIDIHNYVFRGFVASAPLRAGRPSPRSDQAPRA